VVQEGVLHSKLHVGSTQDCRVAFHYHGQAFHGLGADGNRVLVQNLENLQNNIQNKILIINRITIETDLHEVDVETEGKRPFRCKVSADKLCIFVLNVRLQNLRFASADVIKGLHFGHEKIPPLFHQTHHLSVLVFVFVV
jgi:hypothetical protein